jgi:hypothetical protein
MAGCAFGFNPRYELNSCSSLRVIVCSGSTVNLRKVSVVDPQQTFGDLKKIIDLTDGRRLPCAEFPQLHCRILIPLGAAMKRREFILGSATVAIVPPTLLAREVIE